MSEVKVYRVSGKIVKPNLRTPFEKEVRALKEEHAKEQIYLELGSKHRVKRFHIKILKIEEVPPEEVTDATIKKLTQGEGKNVK
jgi:large subunit ribosomal protein LX